MLSSDFWSKVDIWLFRACAMENMLFGSYLCPNRHNSWSLYLIWVREYDVEHVRCLTGSRNMAVSRMCNEKYAIWPLVMAESPKLLHGSAVDLWTRLWGRYHVPQNVFLVIDSILHVSTLYPHHAFSVVGPTIWNSLPDYLRDPAVDSERFRQDLKTYLFAGHS